MLLVIMFVPLGLLEVVPYAKWLFILLIALGIYNFVLQYLGPGTITVLVTAILTIIAVKYLWVTVPLYMIMLVASFFLFQIIGITASRLSMIGTNRPQPKIPMH